MRKRLLVSLVIAAAVAACSSSQKANPPASGAGGSGGSVPIEQDPTKVASASAGEVLKVTADVAALTYTWTTLKSAYVDLATAAPADYSGTGTLSKESASSPRYLMTDDVTHEVMGLLTVADNGTLLARMAIPALNGKHRAFPDNTSLKFGSGVLKDMVSVPVLGVTKAIAKATTLAGTYNFISLNCSGKSQGFFNQHKETGLWNTQCNVPADALCHTHYGTLVVAKGADETKASVHYCVRGNLGGASPTCSGGEGTGTASYDATKGLWLLSVDGSGVLDDTGAGGSGSCPMGTGGSGGAGADGGPSETKAHALVAFTSALGGQKVGWLDTDGGVLGYGQLVLAEQVALTPSAVNGAYRYETSGFNSGSHSLCGSDQAGTVTIDSVAKVTVNQPWTGLGTIGLDPSGESIALMAGAGVYISRNPNDDPWSFEIGTRVGAGNCP